MINNYIHIYIYLFILKKNTKKTIKLVSKLKNFQYETLKKMYNLNNLKQFYKNKFINNEIPLRKILYFIGISIYF